SRSFGLLNASGSRVATLRAERLVYATMTDTDAAVYRLNRTYGQIRSAYGIDALTLNDTRPAAGTAISVVSGYWKRIYNCSIDGFVHRMKEGDWTWKDSVRYTPSCNTIGGTSGSPVVDAATGRVVAVNNTGNEDGERCTVNNPCEIDEQGRVTVRQGINYAQQTYWFPGCFGAASKLHLGASGCALPNPSHRPARQHVGAPPVLDHEPTVHHDVRDARRRRPGLLEGRARPHRGRVEQHQVGPVPLTDQPAVRQPQPGGRPRGQVGHALLQ